MLKRESDRAGVGRLRNGSWLGLDYVYRVSVILGIIVNLSSMYNYGFTLI